MDRRARRSTRRRTTCLSNDPERVNLPNVISLARFLSVPVMLWLIVNERHTLAFWLFLVAGISDAVDGFVAKRWNAVTVLGGYLDAIADKALLVGVFVALGVEGHLAPWLVLLVVFRDLSIAGGWLLLISLSGPRRVVPMMISKVNTTMQIVFAVLILGELAFAIVPPVVLSVGVYIVAATTILSGIGYVMRLFQAGADLESLS